MKRLLVLDDEPRICDFVAALARRDGWQVDVAHDATAFAQRMDTAVPDALFLDLSLGETDGVEVLRDLAARRFTGAIVLMSGFDDRVLEAARVVGSGFGLHIAQAMEKPMRAAALRAVLDALAPAPSFPPSSPPSSPLAPAPVPAAATSTDPASPRVPITIAEVERALAAGEMALHYQPIVRVTDGGLTGLEALLRWRHPVYGAVPPDAFIPIVEADGAAMDRLTDWTIDAALQARGRFEAAGLRAPIAVNISGQCLRHLDFPARLAARLESAGRKPADLSLEITEGIAMVGSRQIIDILTRLRLRGFAVAIDDLGAGYSSLQALLQVPFSYLKIDKAFVAGIATSRDSLSIVRAIAGMARGMSLGSVAEGVETEAIAVILRDLGVGALQGAWLTMPLPAADLIAWEAARPWPWPLAATTPEPTPSVSTPSVPKPAAAAV